MPDSDHVMIDPRPAELELALRQATEAANYRTRVRALAWPPPDLAAFLASFASQAEGRRQWNGGLGRGKSGEVRTVLAVAWWSDYAGRKHIRIVGRRGEFNNSQRANVLCPTEDRPFQWLTYPENLYFRDVDGRWVLWGVCRCGASGEPTSLGWMGNVCGPCHDRLEAGETPPGHDGPRRTLLAGHDNPVAGVAFALGGRWLVSYGRYRREVRMWDLADGTCDVQPVGTRYVTSAAVSPDGGTLAVAHGFEGVSLWDLDSGRHGTPVRSRGGMAHSVVYRPDGSMLALCTSNEIVLHDLSGGWTGAASLARDPGGWWAAGMSWSPDGRCLAVGGRPMVQVYDVQSGALAGPALGGQAYHVPGVAFAPDGRSVAAIMTLDDPNGSVRLWDWPSGEERAAWRAPGNALAFSPDGRLLVTAHGSGLELRDPGDGRRLAAYRWHGDRIQALAFSPDGQWIATASDDTFVKLWPVAGLLGEIQERDRSATDESTR
jgi:hypothetical protein